MNLDIERGNVDNQIEKEYLHSVVEAYEFLFAEVGRRAIEHMEKEGILEIALSPKDLVFNKEKHFTKEGAPIPIKILPLTYQKYSDNLAGQADSRYHTTPTVHEAMRKAFDDFREKVKKSLLDSL